MNKNTHTHRDINTPDGNPDRHHVEAGKNEHLLTQLDAMLDAVNHDAPVTAAMIHDTRHALKNMMLRVGDGDMTLQQLRDDPVMQKNMKIWKEIRGGNFQHAVNMTALTDDVAEALVKRGGVELDFPRVAHITNEQAAILAQFGGFDLNLNGLTEITDEQAQALSEFRCTYLRLTGLSRISDKSAEHLAARRRNIACSDDVERQLSRAAYRLDLP